MRIFIVSSGMLAALLLLWGIYSGYSENILTDYASMIDNSLLTSVTEEHWSNAEEGFRQLSESWHRYKKSAAFFYSTTDINNADYTLAKAGYYIKAKDVSNASGELACLREQLIFLYYNDKIHLGNIF